MQCLRRGISAAAKDGEGNGVYHMVSAGGHQALLKAEEMKEIDLKEQNHRGQTALHLGVLQQHQGIVEVLTNACEDLLNVSDIQGLFPLHCAALMGNNSVLRELMFRSSDVEASTQEGLNILHCAILESKCSTTRYIFARHPYLLASKTTAGDSCLHLAVQTGFETIIRCVLSLGSDPAAINDDGQTPLAQAAAVFGDTEFYERIKV